MGIKKVLQILALDVIIRFAEVLGKKYRLSPAAAEGGQNRQKPPETTISQF